MESFAHCFSSFGSLMYACAEFAPKGPCDGFSTITCQEKREETRTIETETGSQRSPRHNGRPQKGSADAHSEITTVPARGLMEPPQARTIPRLTSVENPRRARGNLYNRAVDQGRRGGPSRWDNACEKIHEVTN